MFIELLASSNPAHKSGSDDKRKKALEWEQGCSFNTSGKVVQGNTMCLSTSNASNLIKILVSAAKVDTS